jgi:hypothetical protein
MQPTFAALLAAVLSISACHTTKLVKLDEAPASRRVLVTLADQSVVEVATPRLFGSRLEGWVDGKYTQIPVADVKTVQVREAASARTAALIIAGAVVATGVVYTVAKSGHPSDTKIQDICDEEPDNIICTQ